MTINTNTGIEGLKADSHSQRFRDWLSPPDPSVNLNKALEQHHPGSGQWFLGGSVYSAWKMERNSFLCLYGIPGCGKTILSSAVIEDLHKSEASLQNVLYFYFDFTNIQKQFLKNAIRSLAYQLYSKRKNVRHYLDSLYSSCEGGKQQPLNDSLRTSFHNMIEQAGEVWIVLDALDECQVQEGRRTEDYGHNIFRALK